MMYEEVMLEFDEVERLTIERTNMLSEILVPLFVSELTNVFPSDETVARFTHLERIKSGNLELINQILIQRVGTPKMAERADSILLMLENIHETCEKELLKWS